MKASLVDDLARQAVHVKAAFFEDLDPCVPVHDPAIGLDPQCFAAPWSERTDNDIRGLLTPVFEGELRRPTSIRRIGVDALQRWLGGATRVRHKYPRIPDGKV